MKEQATANAIPITPLTHVTHEIKVTINNATIPKIEPEEICVRRGDFVRWKCELNAPGHLFISFDPFHSVYAEGCVSAKGEPLQFGCYQIAIDPGTTGSRKHPYRVGWTPTGKETIYVDPVIIVDPTNPTGGPSER